MVILDLLLIHKKGDLSFKDSVALFFNLYPEKKNFLENFLKHEDQFSWKRVRTGLDEKLAELEASQRANAYRHVVPSVHQQNKINLEVLPDSLRAEYGKLGPIMRDISRLHARLDLIDTDANRFLVASEIMTLVKERRRIWSLIDHFLEHGRERENYHPAKPVKPIDPDTAVDYKAIAELQKLRVQRSKLKNKPNRQADFAKVCERIKEIEEKRIYVKPSK